MQTAEKVSVTMTPEMMEAIRESVARGEFASTSEALRDAVRVWQRERQEYQERIEAIRQRIKTSIEDPRPSLTGEQVRARLKRLHANTVKDHPREAL